MISLRSGSLSRTAFVFLFFILHGSFAPAEPIGSNCQSTQTIKNSTIVNQFFTTSSGCLLWITPVKNQDAPYREYYFDERGGFRIFNSLPGDYATSTGSRNFFLFPRRQVPTYRLDQDGSIIATLSTGKSVTISSRATRIQSFEGVGFHEAPEISLTNSGGLEILSYFAVYLDTGWSVGNVAYHGAQGQSVFHDQNGQACRVTNAEIFDYQDAIYGEPLFKFQDDASLTAFLKSRCPQIDTASLKASKRGR